MSKNSEKVYTEGRITYVEPNDFLADKEYSASRSDSFNITHPYEDYAISVDLIVTIPDRFTGKSNDFIIELNNDKDGKTTSFFNGEGGYLNCTPGSSTFLDIMNGDTAGHQENLGITNINITYNSYFYPEVTMNLVDVRGLSLMAPNEENYRRAEVNRYARELAKKQGDKYQPVYDEKIANFFSALFTFPYPEFKLRVKGFYGKKVEYSLLVNDFKALNIDTLTSREPGGSKIAEDIRSVILNVENTNMDYMTEALLYAASRKQHLEEIIKPAIENGKLVICDRYIDSSLAYQGWARGLGIERVYDINMYATEGFLPDLTLFIDIPAEVGLERIKSNNREVDRLDLEKISFHHKVREGYLKVASMYPNRVVVIDGNKSLEEVYADIKKVIFERIK